MLLDGEYETLRRTRLVIVADSIVLNESDVHSLSRIMDMTELRHVEELADAIRPLLEDVVVYRSPKSFVDHISAHRDDVVLPDWSGSVSWSRTGVVPAICEGYAIPYIGGDAYTKIVCHDKFLSKSLCQHAGLPTPAALYVDHVGKLEALALCRFPCVVKPCYEGSSVGVDSNSLVFDADAARARASELLTALNAPVLIEDFCPGREVSICLLGGPGEISAAVGERYIPGDERYFERRLFTFELKKNSKRTALRLVTDAMPPIYLERAKALHRLLRKSEILRIDGRLHDDTFQVIELTPETHLGVRAEYCGTLVLAGLTYTEIIARMILNAVSVPPHPATNRRTSADSSRTRL